MPAFIVTSLAFVAEPALICPPFLTAWTFQSLFLFGPIQHDLYLTYNIAYIRDI